MSLVGNPGSTRRRLTLAGIIYLLTTAVYLACAAHDRFREHTPANHYALLAECWLEGRLDLPGQPPAYTQGNDFAVWNNRWFVSFPPFPALVLLPFVWLAGSPEALPDGLVWLFLAGLSPALVFLALDQLGRRGYCEHSDTRTLLLTGIFAFGSVYFFTAEQGTVWFAAHVVTTALMALFFLAALDAKHPAVAGASIGLIFASRGPTPALGALFFVFEAIRVSAGIEALATMDSVPSFPALLRRLDWAKLVRLTLAFALPLLAVMAVILWLNQLRFGSVFEFGHGLLNIRWRSRMDTWGLFSYHYLARNLGVFLTSLPFAEDAPPYFQISGHGLAVWLTTPAYLWLLWPRRTNWLWWSLLATVVPIMIGDLLYHNSGWLQFGYRFSNDYALYALAMLALGGYRFGRFFWACAVGSVAINALGALTFDRAHRLYVIDTDHQRIYQRD